MDELSLFFKTGLSAAELDIAAVMEMNGYRQLILNSLSSPLGACVGLEVGCRLSVTALGRIGIAMMYAPNALSGFMALEKFCRLMLPYSHVTLFRTAANIDVCVEMRLPPKDPLFLHYEVAMMILHSYVRLMNCESTEGVAIEFAMPRPAHGAQYRGYFDLDPLFNAPVTRLRLPRAAAERASPCFLADIWQNAQYELTSLQRQLGARDRSKYAHFVSTTLTVREPPLPQLTDIAAEIGISARTLSRHLADEGTSYRALRQTAIQHWAELFLQDSSLSIEAIATLLDFTDPSNFRRTFRRLAGMTPTQYRTQSSPSTSVEIE